MGANIAINYPDGRTFSAKKAADLLEVSVYTLKSRSHEWGLHTFWDGRGRRYLIKEIEEAKHGNLKPIEQDVVTEDLDFLFEHPSLDGYRFKVYRTDKLSYLGCYGSDSANDVIELIREDHGGGTYHLKLLDNNYRMTGYNFTINIAGIIPETEAERKALKELKFWKEFIEIYKQKNRKMQNELKKQDIG